MMVGIWIFSNFDENFLCTFSEGIIYKMKVLFASFLFVWEFENSLIYWAQNSAKIFYQNWTKSIYQTSSNWSKIIQNWYIWWCLVYQFCPILIRIFHKLFRKVLFTKWKFCLYHFCLCENLKIIWYTGRKTQQKYLIKIEQNWYTKHHQM